jgi:hypothetical protein
MVGCKYAISKVGITTFVSVPSNLVSPRYPRSSDWRYLPLYFGLLTILRAVPIFEKIEFLKHGNRLNLKAITNSPCIYTVMGY